MKIIAQDTSGGRFLVAVDDKDSIVVDLAHGEAFPKFRTQAILARGYWQPAAVSEEQEKKILALAAGA